MTQPALFSRDFTANATLSPDGLYRYQLDRTWSDDGGRINWIMLNPSTADSFKDDPTIRKCIAFSRAWGYGGLDVTNLYAYRATDPARLLSVPDPIGPDNDAFIAAFADRADAVVAAWGANAEPARAAEVVRIMTSLGKPLTCLGLTKDGMPRHPLYLSGRMLPVSFAYEGDA